MGSQRVGHNWMTFTHFTTISLVVQRWRSCLPTQEVQVQSLVGELRSHMPQSQKTKTWNRSNILTNLIKTVKNDLHQKIFLKNLQVLRISDIWLNNGSLWPNDFMIFNRWKFSKSKEWHRYPENLFHLRLHQWKKPFRTKKPLVPLMRYVCGVLLPYFTRVTDLMEFKKKKMARMVIWGRVESEYQVCKGKAVRTEHLLQIIEKKRGGG